jgi:glycosyltransferase involved in cell wall biosynthesis
VTDAPRILLTTDAVGGVWRYSMELAAGFLAKGAQVVLAGMGPPASPVQLAAAHRMAGLEYLETGLPLDWLAGDPDELRTASYCLADLAERVGADSVQLHAPALAGDAVWPVPVIVVAHSCVGTWWHAVRRGPLPTTLAWRADATARGLVAADAVIVPSRAFGHAVQAAYGSGFSPLVVHNGRSFLRRRATIRPSVFTAGRLWDDGKNIAVLDHAAALAECQIRAAGPASGPDGTQFSARNLLLLGELDHPAMAREYAQAAVFVSAALYEPFGLAVLEAAQSGCALLLSGIPSFRELWNGAALFFDPRDPAALARCLQRLQSDDILTRQLGLAARYRAARYSAARMVARTWAVHRRLQPVRRIAA